MLRFIRVSAGILAAFLLAQSAVVAQATVTYTASTLDFANPERGFYRYSETRSDNYSPLIQSELEGYRQLNTPPTAGYSIYSTLVFRYFFLKDFTSSDITAAYLAAVQADFDVARAAGVKLIPRFAYTDEITTGACGSFICPPYGDAAKVWVLRHIQQLRPVLQANADVTAAVQMGFIGTFGEQYYTDFFGDPSQGPVTKLTDDNWNDRNEVLNALLDAVPASRMVQVRYPQLKQRLVYGVQALTSSAPVVLAEAYSATDKARIGMHNDCLLASDTDFGTYTDYGNTATPTQDDTTALKPYAAAEGEFVAIGGETCTDAYSPQNDCAGTDPLARGDSELRRLGYSYLNSQYNNDVNNDWVSGGCMDNIKRELGYRFELNAGTFTDAVAPGQVLDFSLALRNVGYATPFNARGVSAVLRNTTSGEVFTAAIASDPRGYTADASTQTISESLCVPASMPAGDYELLLHLPDPELSLAERPEYAVRVASLLPGGSDVWEQTTGYNALGHTVTVTSAGGQSACVSETAFAKTDAPLPVELIRFAARPINQRIEVIWQTATEENNAGFEVERSLDGRSFVSIASVLPLGANGLGATYSISDETTQLGTTYYYRVLQRDLDGAVTYSDVVAAQLGLEVAANALAARISVFPNPTDDRVVMAWKGGVPNDIMVHVTDAFGRRVEDRVQDSEIDLRHLPQGLYFLNVSSNEQVAVVRVFRR